MDVDRVRVSFSPESAALLRRWHYQGPDALDLVDQVKVGEILRGLAQLGIPERAVHDLVADWS